MTRSASENTRRSCAGGRRCGRGGASGAGVSKRAQRREIPELSISAEKLRQRWALVSRKQGIEWDQRKLPTCESDRLEKTTQEYMSKTPFPSKDGDDLGQFLWVAAMGEEMEATEMAG